jgi:hypothetical protein
MLFAIGCLLGAVALFVGFQNNNQGEFYDPETGRVDVGYCVAFLLFPGIALSGPIILYHVASWIAKRRGDRR